ncbi:MAG: thermonuclease family protein, partial [Longimicrobiales bacterium]
MRAKADASRSISRSPLFALVLLVLALGAPHAAGAQEPDGRADGSYAARDSGYVASSRGQVYYWVGCDRWRRLSPANRLYFESKAAAEAAGYRPSRSAGCAGPSNVEETRRCVIERVVDGDTVVCTNRRIRLLLIDAPEARQEDLGLRARLALEELLPAGTPVSLEFDVEREDRYGRLLAYVYTRDGAMVNEAIVARGYAVVSVYPPNVRHVERLRAAAAAARRAGAGLWA